MKKFKRGVVSFPKCGRTWIRLFFEYHRLYTGHTPMIVYRHNNEFEYEKRVLLVRHPCDVMVSYHLHNSIRQKGELTISEFIRHRRLGIPGFNKAYAKWNNYSGEQIVVRYEDLFFSDTWRKIVNFFEIKFDQNTFDKCIEMTEFDTVKKNIPTFVNFRSAWRYLAAERGRYDVVNPSNPEGHKFRRGKVGGYVDYMEKDDIDYVLQNFKLSNGLEKIEQDYIAYSKNLHG